MAYIRALPAPTQQLPDSRREAQAVEAGRLAFMTVGCGTCHTPDLGAARGIYSDLLLHDMGTEASDDGSYGAFSPPDLASAMDPMTPLTTLDDLRMPPEVRAGRWRTPPLWGVRDSAPYLHDGRADTLEQAIALHAGQSAGPTARYSALSPLGKQQVLAFLKSLAAPRDPVPADGAR